MTLTREFWQLIFSWEALDILGVLISVMSLILVPAAVLTIFATVIDR